jgi:hypothetical protein
LKRECELPNVLVVTSSSVSEWAENADGFEERVRITDFGLAALGQQPRKDVNN